MRARRQEINTNIMQELPQTLFDVFALSLPRGHGFGNNPPIGAWRSNDSNTCGIITRNVDSGNYGIITMRRRVDQVWIITLQEQGMSTFEYAYSQLEPLLKDDKPAEPLPSNSAPHPALFDLKGRTPSDIFKLLQTPSHHVAAWMLNQIYLAIPNPDQNWVSDCQTSNFHTRLWEAQLLASFREQGIFVTQPFHSPDFRIENRLGGEAWVEAVTANPTLRYNHVNATPIHPPKDIKERVLGTAALRFAKTIGNKLQLNYTQLPHVKNKPFVLALADFHAPSSMVWSREALICYLYGILIGTKEIDGLRSATMESVDRLIGPSQFPAGLFCDTMHNELSAVIFSNACSISKFNRVGVSAGALTKGLRYVRVGHFFDRTPCCLESIPFCLDITSDDYRSLWPQHYEPWSAELEVFHNPYANFPLQKELIPEATHWFINSGDIYCESFYETSILSSTTLIQKESDEMPKLSGWEQLTELIEI